MGGTGADRGDRLSDVGVVVIGRNEGERLLASLRSVQGHPGPVVYVDSASTDGSIDRVRAAGVDAIGIVDGRLSAARARNEGLAHVAERAPGVRYVHFVDGDTRLDPEWIRVARDHLEAHEDVGLVCGALREADADTSVFKRLCDVEWWRPPGPAEAVGGIFMIRRDAFEAVHGFDASLRAGEEPEFCARVRAAGWLIERLGAPMGLHDAGAIGFSGWWLRQQRSAYGSLDVRSRAGLDIQRRQCRSALAWTVGWSVLTALAAAAAGAAWGWGGAVAAVSGAVALWMAQALRIAVRTRRSGHSWKTGLAYGFFILLGKWAYLRGMVSHRADRKQGAENRSFEYKRPLDEREAVR